jgi:hypothetical protein
MSSCLHVFMSSCLHAQYAEIIPISNTISSNNDICADALCHLHIAIRIFYSYISWIIKFLIPVCDLAALTRSKLLLCSAAYEKQVNRQTVKNTKNLLHICNPRYDVSEKFKIGIGDGLHRPCPCHTTRHAGPHRAVREIEVRRDVEVPSDQTTQD